MDENILWVGTDDGNVQVSQDGGKKWTNTIKNIDGVPDYTWVYHIEASNFEKGRAYVVFDGHTQNDQATYVYKTDDFGKTWTSLVTDELEGSARSFQEDLVNPNLLFLGTEFGLYISIDGGTSWKKFTQNFPATAVHYLCMQKATNDLVAGTHGRGIIILDDVSTLREITPEILEKDVHFFNIKPAVMEEESGFGGASGETQFVGANPSSVALIPYYLKKRHTFGKMTIEIQDMEGNKLTDIAPKKSKGINITRWNFATKTPKVAKGKSFAYGGFQALRAEAGEYKVVMKKGKETYESTFTISNDPNSIVTDEERQKHREVSQQLFDMTEQLAYMVYSLEEYVKYAEGLKAKDASVSKTADALVKASEEFKENACCNYGRQLCRPRRKRATRRHSGLVQ